MKKSTQTPTSTAQLTHFGFENVTAAEKLSKVTQVFTSVASKYDLMNDLMSFGIHRIWKKIALSFCHLRPGQMVIDLAGGTGDLTYQIIDKIGEKGRVFLVDINASMLQQGRSLLLDQGKVSNISYIQADAESLPFASNSIDCICIAFGLRNVTHIEVALKSMFNVLKPGGCLMILEFSTPVIPSLSYFYDLYSFNVLPWLGKVITGDQKSYQYLVESIRMHPDQITLKDKMEKSGFERCDYFNLNGGIVAIHRGYKL